MDPTEKGVGDGGEKEVTGTEDEPALIEVAASAPTPAAGRGAEQDPKLPDVSVVAEEVGSACPTVPSQTHVITTSHAEELDRNLLPCVEENSDKQCTKVLPDLLSDSASEVKIEPGPTTDSKDAAVEDLLNLSIENEGTREKECSGVCGWISQGDSVLPSMGILPETEKTVPQASQPQRSQPPGATAASATGASAAAAGATARPASPPRPTDPSEVVHKIKKIKWQDIEVPIITQNNNGPCPLLAIVNVMILKGQITLPSDRSEITGGELVLVVGNALVDQPRNSLPIEMQRHLEKNTEDAISILHKLLTGLDVNVKFSGVRDFEFTGELCIFDLLGIMLYHGWVVDPGSDAAPIISSLSYNQLTNNICAWKDEAIKNNNDDLLMKAMLCEDFINSSRSQLTIHGLFELGSALEREEIAVLFRNNHFSTIYKRGDQLYQLLTDQGFLHENMVWETLSDVDASFSEFVNGNFETIPPAPDPSTSSSSSSQNMTLQQQISSDQELAAMLQREADQQQQQQQNFERLKDSLGLHNLTDEEMAKKLQDEENRLAAEASAEAQVRSPPVVDSTSLPVQPNTTQANPSQSSSHSQEERKKKDCVIL